MKIVSKGLDKGVKIRIAAVALAFMVLSPFAAFSQEEVTPDDQDDPTELSLPSTPGTGPWENSAGSTVGRDNTSTTSSSSTGSSSTPRLARPSGPTTDDRDPSGNPDVPFDDNMNLAFLATGIVFAGVILRKKLVVREVPVNTKE